VDKGRRVRALLCVAAVVLALAPVSVAADEPQDLVDQVTDGDPWFCYSHYDPYFRVCVPPF
jgi:hypothetical protein